MVKAREKGWGLCGVGKEGWGVEWGTSVIVSTIKKECDNDSFLKQWTRNLLIFFIKFTFKIFWLNMRGVMRDGKTTATVKDSKDLVVALTGIRQSNRSYEKLQSTQDQLGTSWSTISYIMGCNGTFILILLSKAQPSQGVPC